MADTMKETTRARAAYIDFVALGPDRSLGKLLEKYRTGPKPVPTTNMTRLKEWSRRHGWQSRLQAIADAEVREAEAREAAHRREVMETGYALDWERIRALKELTTRLETELLAPGGLWVREAKVIGSGKNAREVTVERFNAAEIEQFRGVLADLAKETGGRKDATVVTGDAESPLEVRHEVGVNLSRLTDDELNVLEGLLRAVGEGRVSPASM